MSACIKFFIYDGYGSTPLKQYIDVADTSEEASDIELIYPSDGQTPLFVLRTRNSSQILLLYLYKDPSTRIPKIFILDHGILF